MSKQSNEPAFPTPEFVDGVGEMLHTGMTLRDYFAAKAMAVLLSVRTDSFGQYDAISVSREAYWVADYMILTRAHDKAAQEAAP